MAKTTPHALAGLAAVLVLALSGCSGTSSIRYPGSSVFLWSGLNWQVRTGFGGPGPNTWSDRHVYIDGLGRLHFLIQRERGEWACAEIVSLQEVGRGEYRFYLSTRVDNLDPNVTLGTFVYKSDTEEIDIEHGRFGDPGNFNGHYSVQPATPGHTLGFPVALNGAYSTHRFVWYPDQILFQSIHGHRASPPTPGHVIQEWTYSGDHVPEPSGFRAHINLWLFQGAAPTNGRPVHVIVDRMEYLPAGG